jgi:Flp pilus assembly protein CpaB
MLSSGPSTPALRLTDRLRPVRRAVLRRRRPIAALLAGLAVAATVHAVAAPEPPSVPVLVAARDLPAGAELASEDLVTVRFAPGSAPEQVARDPVGQVLAAPLRRGEPVTDVRLVGPELTAGEPGLTAVPVRLPDPGMVALLDVGDRIDLVASDPQAGGADVVAADVPVLAIPAADDQTGAAGLPGRLVVVGAETSQVTPLAEASVRSFVTFTWAGD